MQLHPQEALLQQARALEQGEAFGEYRQRRVVVERLEQGEAFGEYRQRRVVVERRLARLVQLGIRQSQYFGRAKTKFQLYLAATVANLTLFAAKVGLPANTGGETNVGSAFRTAPDFVPTPLAQFLTLALLA